MFILPTFVFLERFLNKKRAKFICRFYIFKGLKFHEKWANLLFLNKRPETNRGEMKKKYRNIDSVLEWKWHAGMGK